MPAPNDQSQSTNVAANIHETAFVNAFIRPERRERILGQLASERGRKRLRQELDHFKAIDPRFAISIPPGLQTPGGIASLLRSRGAPDRCHLLSSNSEIDGKDMDLDEALSKVVGCGDGTILSCIPGRLAYFEEEGAGVRFILQR